MLEGQFNTSFPSFSIYDGGVSSGTVDSMLFSGISSFGSRPLDSYMSELDFTLVSSGNSWSPRSSTFSRFLDSSPLTTLSITRNYGSWGWGGDWGMGYLMRAMSMPFFMPTSDIFNDPRFQFSSPDESAFDTSFPQSTIPDYSSYTPSSNGSTSSGGTTKTTREQPELKLPGKADIPPDVQRFIDDKNAVADPKDPTKPRIVPRFEEVNGQRYLFLDLEYGQLTQDSIDNADLKSLDALKKELAGLVKGKQDIAIRMGDLEISDNEELQNSSMYAMPTESFKTTKGVFKNYLENLMENENAKGEAGSGTVKCGGFDFEHSNEFKVKTGQKDGNGHYYVDASRKEGEKAIRELVGKGEKEEAWVYVEYVDEQGKYRQRWFECGEEEKGGSVEANITFLKQMVKDKSLPVSIISLYHNHPDKKGSYGFDPPSDDDLTSAAQRLRDTDFESQYIDMRVVTKEGIYVVSAPEGSTTEGLKGNVAGYKSKLAKRDGSTTFASEVKETGFDCRLVYFTDEEESTRAAAK